MLTWNRRDSTPLSAALDSGFKSYPSRPEVYMVKNVVWLTTTLEGSNYWGYGYKTQHSNPRSRWNHLKKARGEIWLKCSEKRNNTKTTKMRTKKSAIDKKLILVIDLFWIPTTFWCPILYTHLFLETSSVYTPPCAVISVYAHSINPSFSLGFGESFVTYSVQGARLNWPTQLFNDQFCRRTFLWGAYSVHTSLYLHFVSTLA